MTITVRFGRSALLLASVSLMAMGAAQPAQAQDAGRLQAIEAQIRSLQGELNRMRRESSRREGEARAAREEAATARAEASAAQRSAAQAVAAAPAAAPAEPPVRLAMPGGRPTFTSPDGRFSASVGALIHFDMGGYIRDGRGNPDTRGVPKMNSFGTNLRRARIPFSFRYDDFTLNVTPEFGGSPDGSPSLYEANINWNPVRPLTITAGYFKPWLTLGDSTSSNAFLFMERPSIVDVGRSIAAGDSRASFGARWADRRWFASAYLTGAAYGSQSSALATPQQTGGAFRVAGRPIASEDWDMHLGFSTSMAFDIGRTANGQTIQLRDRPELRIDNNRLIDTGAIAADNAYQWGPEFGLRWRNFMLQGEYMRIGVDQAKAGAAPRPDLAFEGGYVEASWVMTGERRSYSTSSAAFGGIRPARPFSFRDGGMGAFELVGRYSVIDLNDHVTRGRSASSTGGVFGGRQEVIGAGINWYPNNNMRFMLQWNNVNVDRLNASGTTQIGQRFDTVAMRMQASF
ncbi:porin [Roseococcus sp. SYP-B2431]|uniref:OprO/OprP family phosphate-selective porin n=1 Tax=Roseococcus sp. SYP-B2431 TaxID=2496640 RepID=UPI00103FDD38|nr:porin [Roseococcus sp. SYP-B2431]TCH99818.1 porin [Roseococcus sp. SYP-B2431]